jgi:hypothetical protein
VLSLRLFSGASSIEVNPASALFLHSIFLTTHEKSELRTAQRLLRRGLLWRRHYRLLLSA